MAFREFQNDPFFNQRPMMYFPDEHMFPGRRPMLTLPMDGHSHLHQSMLPFGMVDPFQRMNDMMRNFEHMSQQMMQQTSQNPSCHSYSQSTVMHFSNDGTAGGQPKMYQTSVSTRKAPGGIEEVRKTEKDSTSGLQKMSVSHRIGDRSHTISKQYNSKTDEREENQDFVNLDEEDAGEFSNEWDKKTKTERHSRHQITAPQLAITRGLPSSSHGTAGLLSGQSSSVNNYGDDILTSHPSSTHQRPSHTHEQRSFQPRSRPYDDGLNKQGSSIHEQQRARKKRSKVKFNDQ